MSTAAYFLIAPLRYRGGVFLRMRAPILLSLLMLLPFEVYSCVSKLFRLDRSAIFLNHASCNQGMKEVAK